MNLSSFKAANLRVKVKVECINLPTTVINYNDRTSSPVASSSVTIGGDTTEPGRLRSRSDALMGRKVDTGIAHTIKLIKIVEGQR